MALTLTKVDAFVVGDRQARIYDVVFDSSYPLGGEAVTPASFGLTHFISAVIAGVARDPDTADNAFALDYDATNKKLILFYGDNNNAADGPLIELPDTTSAAAYTARVVVIGK